MKDRYYIWATALVIGVTGLGVFAVDQWLIRTAGRSPQALAIADMCVNREHEDEAVRAETSTEIAAACDQYFRFRSDQETELDERRWRQRNEAKAAGRQ